MPAHDRFDFGGAESLRSGDTHVILSISITTEPALPGLTLIRKDRP